MEMTMSFEDMIAEHKRKSAVINSLVIDWQYLVELAPQVFNKNAAASPDFKNACNALYTLCDRAAKEMEELKAILPVVREDN
jgi:hypothetical protein